MGCAHSTVARWVSMFWGSKESGKQKRCWPDIQLQQLTVSVFPVRRHYWVWTCAEPSSEIGIGLSTSQKMSCRSESIKICANLLPDCLAEMRLYNMWRLPDCIWDFTDGKVNPSFAGSLPIMRYGPIRMNLAWRSDSDVNSVTSDHHICANINRNWVSWKSCSVLIMITRVSYCTCPSWHDSKHCLLSHCQESDWLV